MDSIVKLQTTLQKIEDRDTDKDVKIRDQWLTIRCWVNDFRNLDENIRETSLNEKHMFERMEKAINEIYSIR